MSRVSGLLIAALALAVFAWGQQAATSKAVYVVTHVDFVPSPAGLAEPVRLLREFAAESRKDPGSVRFEVLQQDSRLNHFTIVEVWQTRQAFDAHTAAAHSRRFREKLQPLLGSPFDERLHGLLP